MNKEAYLSKKIDELITRLKKLREANHLEATIYPSGDVSLVNTKELHAICDEIEALKEEV